MMTTTIGSQYLCNFSKRTLVDANGYSATAITKNFLFGGHRSENPSQFICVSSQVFVMKNNAL